MASKSGAVTGAIFVVSLTLLMFLFNGDLAGLSLFFSGLSQYQGYISQTLVYLAVLGFGAVAMKAEGLSWHAVGVSKRNLLLALPVLIVLVGGTIAIAIFTGDWTQTVGQWGSGPSPIALLGAIVFASFVEEYVFRGYVQNGTARRFGVTAGIVVSAAVFSLAHVPTDISGLGANSGLAYMIESLAFSASGRFFFGVLAFSTIYYLTGNFFITFFTHALYDISVVYLAPPDGSVIYRSLFIIVPYVAFFILLKTGSISSVAIRGGLPERPTHQPGRAVKQTCSLFHLGSSLDGTSPSIGRAQSAPS